MEKLLCTNCGAEHDLDEIEITFGKPDPYFDIPEDQRSARCWISPDACAIDEQRFFLRGLLPIPVQGREYPYSWGAWAEVSEDSFTRILELWDDEAQSEEPPFEGTLATNILPYPDTLGLPLFIRLEGPDSVPSFEILDKAHPIGVEQREGVDTVRVVELIHAYQ